MNPTWLKTFPACNGAQERDFLLFSQTSHNRDRISFPLGCRRVKRRIFLGTMGAAIASANAALAQDAPSVRAEPPAAFGFENVTAMAQKIAATSFRAPDTSLQAPFKDLDYDAYRAVRFRRDRDPWADLGAFGIDLLPPGMLFSEPVRINLVEDGRPAAIAFDPSVFDFDPVFFPPNAAQSAPEKMGWSGFRLRAALNRPDVLDELAVFQGASYFRVLGRGNRYGLSARGLTIGTAAAEGEEFPAFREFWLHRPEPGRGTLTVHALLDSKSLAGAFEFVISPGADTVLTTQVALFPRRDLTSVGIAPLTSMFWFGPADGAGHDDYRPAVHDSDGLAMITGAGQRLWRVLSNPSKLQISAFMDRDPRGFGLRQSRRDFRDFQDAEARYELRPSAFVRPLAGWGKGAAQLIEIPVENEFHDNIVSFWQSADKMTAGQRHEFSYQMVVGSDVLPTGTEARVVSTRSGKSVNTKGARSYVVDFDLTPFDGRPDPLPTLTSSQGRIEKPYVLRLEEAGILRLSFEFLPDGAQIADISAVLRGPDGDLTETWLYRWSES